MQYVCGKRFKGEGLAGHFNIPARSCLSVNAIGRICYKDRAVCSRSSTVAHDYFAKDDDLFGIERFTLTQEIRKLLEGAKTETHLKRWAAVEDDALCDKYRKHEHEDHWLWNDDFYGAPVPDLEYILKLIKEVK